ncbi:UPF0481 protein [Cinnamomum micranthum f. kanehirae]|uniref:UPF0481 protein n=1 Tax=Cinnamomum micranthum f. kanehirae TaxID=337451 RepID=A0A3S3NBQ5_9MAGN|nr:UPF0481 protein [Cinnamomum micranthum f. kanehirae]
MHLLCWPYLHAYFYTFYLPDSSFLPFILLHYTAPKQRSSSPTATAKKIRSRASIFFYCPFPDMKRFGDVREIERLATTVTEHIMLHEDEEGVELWKKHSIYKVPAHAVAVNPEVFKPKVVSIGPYHHGIDHLKPMEVHKQRAARCFIRYSRKNHRGLYQGFVGSSAKVDRFL